MMTTTGQSKKVTTISAHIESIEEVCDRLGTTVETGLGERDAIKRLERDGLNTFTAPKEKAWYWLLAKEFTSGFALLLWFASIASFVTFALQRRAEDAYLGGVLVFTVVLTGVFSYYQQASSSKVFKSFKNMTPQSTIVLREGKKRQIPVEQLVVGDIVYCSAGDRIPADIRIVESNSMKVDNSSITGESEPLLRSVETETGNRALEASNLAFFSTACTDGSGVGVVIATGDRTVMGDIAAIVSNIGEDMTPIAKEISWFVKIITVISVISGLLFFGIAYWFGTSFFSAFLFMIGITVGNVPEGLLPALTVSLTITAKRMAAKQCLVKHLEAVETLGSTSTICTDKTGTLTLNQMTVEHLWFGSETYIFRDREMKHELFEPEIIRSKLDWLALKRCAMLCSRAEFLDSNPIVEERKCTGDASETAIMRFLEIATDSVEDYRSVYPKMAEKPFSSTYKYQYSIHRNNDPNDGQFRNHFLVMKGAPERIFNLCNRRVDHKGRSVAIDRKFVQMFEEVYREYGSQGERVLAFCDLDLSPLTYGEDYDFHSGELNGKVTLENLRFLGLISMIDPPRPNVPEAVRLCRGAGVRVVMVTGDHPITAQAIAKMVGIISISHERSTSITSLHSTFGMSESRVRSIVVPGDELDQMSREELEEILLMYGEIVFARTSPKQKLRIVESFQKLGEIVAVTGDGVNDSPALKKADIGIAMGITGSEVSKQAADMILLDDNFATIVTGIEEGRRIFDNMKKTVSYILAGNVTEIYPFVLYATVGFPLAISTITALMIALGTDMVPAISLSYEDAECDIMKIKPRNAKKDRLVDSKLLLRAYLMVGIIASSAAFFSYFVSMMEDGYTPLMLFNSRSRWNDHNDTFPRIDHVETNGTIVYRDTTFEERKQILINAQSAYFCGVIVIQWVDVVVCKTRRMSLFQHGMGNWVLNLSLLFETGIAALVLYTPVLDTALQTSPVTWRPWAWAAPFAAFLFTFDELRKWIVRKCARSFLGRELLA